MSVVDDGAPAPRYAGKKLKHLRVADALDEAIRRGDLATGERLAGEHDLAQQLDVSRGTVRKALEELARRRLISTETGRGSFVTFDGRDLDAPGGWARALLETGVSTVTQVLRLELVSDPELCVHLGAAQTVFLAVDRVRRLSDGQVISLERSRVPAVPALHDVPEDGLVDDSLTATLRTAGLVVAAGEEWVQVAGLDDEAAEVFGRPVGAPCLHTLRVSRDATGQPVEQVTSYLDPDRFRLHTRF